MQRHVAQAVIAGLADDGFQRKGDQRHDGEKRREDDEHNADGQLALRSLTSRTWPLLPVTVVKDLRLPVKCWLTAQNQAAQQDGDKRDDVALTLIAGLNQRAHLGGERIALHRRAEEHGHGVRAEAAGKDQQEGRENRGHDNRDGHAADNRRAGWP